MLITNILKFINRYYWLFLLLIVLVSYGGLLGMMPWQDDNALMFKLANLEGKAGFLGRGPLGEGPYKYAAAFYIPIYWLFEYRHLSMYFLFCLILYYLATLAIYKTFSDILGKIGGKIAGLFFACGYIASDGFIRLYNSAGTSISIILSSFLLYSYWKFKKTGKYVNYIFVIIFYWLSSELVRYRTHYLLLILVAFEVIFFVLQKKRKLVEGFKSLVRLIPPTIIFYYYFIVNLDSRSSGVTSLLKDMLKGRFYNTIGFVGSFGNLIVPGWISDTLWNLQYFLVKVTHLGLPFAAFLITLFYLVGIFYIFRGSKRRNWQIMFYTFIAGLWHFISRDIYTTNFLSINEYDFFIAYMGGICLILAIVILFKIKQKSKPLYFYLLIWLIANIGSYSAYLPYYICISDHRYLAHSFVALSGIWGLFAATAVSKTRRSYLLIIGLIVVLSFGNMLKSVSIFRKVISDRSNPVRVFYQQLKVSKPLMTKGDLFYFDVSREVERRFADAFSVAQMPEETAIAWRYGLDRYDITWFVSFEDLVQHIKENNVDLAKVNSYLYTKAGLEDTSTQFRNLLENGLPQRLLSISTKEDKSGEIIDFSNDIASLTPVNLNFDISALPTVPSLTQFPLVNNNHSLGKATYKNPSLRAEAFAYSAVKKTILKTATVTVSSVWRKDFGGFLMDQNLDTFWRSDRVLWGQEKEASFTLDLKKVMSIGKFVWINADADNTPVDYAIDISIDGKQWRRTAHTKVNEKIQRGVVKEIMLDKVQARYVRMVFYKTLQGDSPEILEAWVVPTEFSYLDIRETEEFLKRPLDMVPSQLEYFKTLKYMSNTGQIRVYWFNDKDHNWSSEFMTLSVRYNGRRNSYSVQLPAGGTSISRIKLENFEIPGEITVHNVWASNPRMVELK